MIIPTVDIWTRPTEEAALNQIVARDWNLKTLFDEKLRTRQVFDRQNYQVITVNLKRQYVALTANDLLEQWDGKGSLMDFLEQFTWQ